MLEAAISDSAQKLRAEEKLAEAGAVDGRVRVAVGSSAKN
jgi:hypothetical protein